MKYILSVALLLLPGSAVFAQATLDIDSVTITATLAPQNGRHSARDLEVLSGSQFNTLPVHSLDELLRYVPGVEVQARGPMGTQVDIVIRGGTFQQVLVLVDGLRLNDPVTGHFNSNIPIAPNEIDRIEILKGAASAIYGAEAVGGVVHIITKSFSGMARTGGSAKITAGQYGYLGVQAGGSVRKNQTVVSGGVLYNHADGVPQRGINGYFDNTTVSVSVAQQLGPSWTLAARSAYDNRDFAAQNFYTGFKSDTATEQVRSFWQQAGLRYAKNRWQLRLDGGYKSLRDEYAFSPAAVPNDNRAALYQGLGVATRQFADESRLTFGGQWVSGKMESNDRGNHQLGQGGLFALYSRRVAGKLLLEPALRLSFPQQGSARLIPQLNAAWLGRQYRIWSAIGSSLREPDFTERFNNYNKTLVKSGSIGNPDLQAEKGLSYELGAEAQLMPGFQVSASAFRREQKNLIDFVTTPYANMPRQVNLSPTGNYSLAQNIAAVNTLGLELNVHYHRAFASGNLAARAGGMWLKSEGINGTPGFYISSHARFLANGFLTYEYRFLSLSATLLYKERQTFSAPAIEAEVSPAYFTAGLRVEAKLKPGLAVFVQADNLTDTRYSDLLGAQMPGRWWSGGIRLFTRPKA